MPFFELAEDCHYYHPNIICPVASCKKVVTQKQAVFVCSQCCRFFHPPCKGIIGSARIKKAAESNWYCSSECNNDASSQGQVLQLNGSPTTNSCTPSKTSIQHFMHRIDVQFAEIKTMIAEIKESQNFINKEFEEMKTEIKTIVADNIVMKKKCKDFEITYRKHDERIRNLEFNLDEYHQRDLNSNLIVVGLPDKLTEPTALIRSLFSTLQCESSISEVTKCEYLMDKNTFKQHSHSSNNNKILVKFTNPSSKNKVVQLKKKLKPTLKASDIGFSQNQNTLYFRDNLTPLRSALFKEAREFKKTKHFKYVWISEGNILIREAEGSKIIRVKSNADLNNL